jgi:hypothetical protein
MSNCLPHCFLVAHVNVSESSGCTFRHLLDDRQEPIDTFVQTLHCGLPLCLCGAGNLAMCRPEQHKERAQNASRDLHYLVLPVKLRPGHLRSLALDVRHLDGGPPLLDLGLVKSAQEERKRRSTARYFSPAAMWRGNVAFRHDLEVPKHDARGPVRELELTGRGHS